MPDRVVPARVRGRGASSRPEASRFEAVKRARIVVMGLIVLLVAPACRADTTVDIRVDDDGSGRAAYTVVANAEAVSLLVDDPTDLRFDDLAAAGWNLDGPIAEDGGVTITASKPFLHPKNYRVCSTS